MSCKTCEEVRQRMKAHIETIRQTARLMKHNLAKQRDAEKPEAKQRSS